MKLPDSIRDSAWYAIVDDDWPREDDARGKDRTARRVRCAVDVAPVRAEPRDDAEQVTQAIRGEPLAGRGAADGWARV